MTIVKIAENDCRRTAVEGPQSVQNKSSKGALERRGEKRGKLGEISSARSILDTPFGCLSGILKSQKSVKGCVKAILE